MKWKNICKPRWKEIEQEYLPKGTKRMCSEFEGTKLYYLTNIEPHIEPHIESHIEPIQSVIVLHGISSSSLTFSELIEKFPFNTRFFVLDLPGFGKSYTRYPIHAEQYITTYIEIIRQFMDTQAISSAYFIGHSLGSFISICFASTYPTYVKSLILISPVGILPTLDYCGGWYALLFRFGFPYLFKIIRIFKYFIYLAYTSLKLFRIFNLFKKIKRYVFYDLSLICDCKGFGEQVARSLITINKGSYWNYPVLDKLVQLNVPISLIYGSTDNITPFHQGIIIQGILPHIHLEIIEEQWHNPISNISVEMLKKSFEHTSIFPDKHKPIQKELSMEIHRLLECSHEYSSTLSKSHTRTIVHRMYTEILQISRQIYQKYHNLE